MSKWLNEELIFPSVKAYIDKLAEGLNLPPVVILQNMIIKRLAEENAAADVYGPGGELLTEFIEQDGTLLTGPELYKMLYDLERERLEREYVDTLEATPWEDCSKSEKELLTRYGIGPVAEQKKKEKQQNIDELREKYNLPKRKPGQNSHWEE
jgi:hypothetical protein